MTFSYNETLAANLDLLRFKLGDTIEDSGPRPLELFTNFSDETLAALLAAAGSANTVLLAAIAVADSLISEWTRFAGTEREGQVTKALKDVADFWKKQKEEWEKEANSGSQFVGFVEVEREDAYSDS